MTITDEVRYGAAVGPRAHFYVPKFLRFDAGESRISWNWPAFFIGVLWMLYRRMWSTAVYLFLISLGLGLIEGLILERFLGERTSDLISYATTLICMIVVGVFANTLYHARIKRRIAQLVQSGRDEFQVVRALERGPHTSWAGVIIVAVFLVVAFIGIIAAIAIPAYQDYTIRAQVTEGLNLAGAAKAAVAESYARDGHWPADLKEAGMAAPPTGKYVSDVTIDHGTIQITYGNAAHPQLAGQRLSIRPTVFASDETEDVVWSCGYAEAAESEPPTGAAGRNRTTVPKRYLPLSCRQ
ncbi:MAG: pilin [Steroidobacteraceae bacterium]